MPPLLGGADVVLAAETGSGKTLAYLAPIADALLRARAAPGAEGGAGAQGGGGEQLGGGALEQRGGGGEAPGVGRPLALVLVPNTALAAQVIAAAGLLRCGGDGGGSSTSGGSRGPPLLHVITVSSRSPPPFERPDVVVTTPGCARTRERWQ